MRSTTNRNYKDRLFIRIFGQRENALSLYNAVNGTDYQDADALEIFTMEDVIYLSMKNDVSFLLSGEINLYEQQSTYNPNMPARAMMYMGRQYEKYIRLHDINVFSPKLQRLPVPRCIVFYNGDADRPEEEEMKLTDAYGEKAELSSIEVTVKVYNVNYPKNEKLLSSCKALHDYSRFIGMVKQLKREGLELGDAIDRAVETAADEDLLGGFFRGHRAEVKDLVLTEYDEEKVMRAMYEDGLEEGRAEGLEKGRAEANNETARKMKVKGISVDLIAECTGLTEEEIDAL